MEFRQIDPGTYTVVVVTPSGPHQVGWCYVEGTGQGTTVEHYALHQNYASPDSGKALRVALASGVSYSSTSEFFAAMHDEEPANAPYIYIRSACTKYSAVP